MSEQDVNEIKSPVFEDIATLMPKTIPTRGERRKKMLWCIDHLRNKPGEYNTRLIKTMQECGMKKPSFILQSHWDGEKPEALTPRDTVICYQAAWGLKPDEIGKGLGCSESFVKGVIQSVDGIKRIREIQFQIWGKDPKKWIQSILPEAIMTAKEIMTDPTAKPQTRLNAAQDFMDRNLGKAQQTIEVHDTNMRRVIDMLDRIERAKAGLPVEAGEGQDVIDVDFSKIEEEGEDDVDKFIEETYGKKI